MVSELSLCFDKFTNSNPAKKEIYRYTIKFLKNVSGPVTDLVPTFYVK